MYFYKIQQDEYLRNLQNYIFLNLYDIYIIKNKHKNKYMANTINIIYSFIYISFI